MTKYTNAVPSLCIIEMDHPFRGKANVKRTQLLAYF